MLKKTTLVLVSLIFVSSTVSYSATNNKNIIMIPTNEEIKSSYEEVLYYRKKHKNREAIESIDKTIDLTESKLQKDSVEKDKFLSYLFAMKSYHELILGYLHDAWCDADKAIDLDNTNGYAYYIKSVIYGKYGDWKMENFYLKKAANLGYQYAQEYIEVHNL